MELNPCVPLVYNVLYINRLYYKYCSVEQTERRVYWYVHIDI